MDHRLCALKKSLLPQPVEFKPLETQSSLIAKVLEQKSLNDAHLALISNCENTGDLYLYFKEFIQDVGEISPKLIPIMRQLTESFSNDFIWLYFGYYDQLNFSKQIYNQIEFMETYFTKMLYHYAENQKCILSEGYYLVLDKMGYFVFSKQDHGSFNGLQSLIQLLQWQFLNINTSAKDFPTFHIFDFPKLELRAFHLDLKYSMPTFPYIKELLKFLACFKQNTLFIEYEDKFPYKDYLGSIPHQNTWTPEEFAIVKTLCKQYFIEIVPLVQVFGHVETFLRKDNFKHLQESENGLLLDVPKLETWSLCPLHSESEKFAYEIVDQIIAGHPNSRFVHIGADEVYQLGTCPKCKAFVKSHSKSELYIHFINKVANRVLSHGKIPIIWHDYLLKFPENLDKLNKQIVIMYWIYESWRDEKSSSNSNIQILPGYEFFQEHGFQIMGAPSISADFDLFLPNYRTRMENCAGQAMRASETRSLGMLNTSWVVCANPLDTQLLGIAMAAGYMWCPPLSWDDLGWNQIEFALQTHVFGVSDNLKQNWFQKFAQASEKSRHIYPTEDACQILPQVIAQILEFLPLVHKNQRILESLLWGLRFRKMIKDSIVKYWSNYDILSKYADNEEKSADFPSLDELNEFHDDLSLLIDEYPKMVLQIHNYYTRESQQIIENDFWIVFELERYHLEKWLINLKDNLNGMLKQIDAVLLDLHRQEMRMKR